MAVLPGQSPSVRLLSHLLFVTLTIFAATDLSQAATAYVRVNQVGYVGGSTKRAYLMASGAETGATFAVKNSGSTTVYSASVGTSLGAWGLSPASTLWISIRYQPPGHIRFRLRLRSQPRRWRSKLIQPRTSTPRRWRTHSTITKPRATGRITFRTRCALRRDT